uniref:Protein kish-B n=1 Tax=Ficedula albicollis TaxID=59894 RepID=A0A803VXC8_FICAL
MDRALVLPRFAGAAGWSGLYSLDGLLVFGLLLVCTCAYLRKVPRLRTWLLSERRGVWGVCHKGERHWGHWGMAWGCWEHCDGGTWNTGVQDGGAGMTGVGSGTGTLSLGCRHRDVGWGFWGLGWGHRVIGNGNSGVWDGNVGSGMGSQGFRMDLGWGHGASPHLVPPAAAVIGTRLHVAVSVSCLLMAFYVLLGK